MTGSPSDPKPGIPAWQRASTPATSSSSATDDSRPSTPSSPSSTSEAKTADDAQESQESPSNDQGQNSGMLLEHAKLFLKDATIRDAPAERKRQFLQSKGVNDEDINELLGNSKDQEAGSAAITAKESPQEPAKGTSKSIQSLQTTSQTTSREVPPIVMYPEFLAQPTSPPPLITASRIFNVATALAGFGAVTYGVSNYLVQPMTEALTDARRDFASNTQENLDKLNTKLESMVSTLPTGPKKPVADLDKEYSDIESASDPTELYHRDIGVQTSPSLSRRASHSSESSRSSAELTTSQKQEENVEKLSGYAQDFNNLMDSNMKSEEAVASQLGELRTYLTEMAYSSPYYSGDMYSSRFGSTKRPEDDAIEAFKADIRSVKGVFLSAKNFPSSPQTIPGRTPWQR
ncbi:peroxisomal membrane anchor protein conserved region-domain-containing protein [Phyllosticta citrichinensis]|uniref:Peroxisomal membrane protein PEX14 n=1 Tax=Phyllosticta citrichinensis TaxID=1130410 RepID=A0ABR1Y198_9PEZI